MIRYLKLIVEYWKAISAVIAIVSVISVTAVKIDRKKQQAEARNNSLDRVTKAVDNLSDSTIMFFNITNKELSLLREEVTGINKRVNKIDESYVNHLKNAEKWDEVIIYLQEIKDEVKKNGTTGYQIPLIREE